MCVRVVQVFFVQETAVPEALRTPFFRCTSSRRVSVCGYHLYDVLIDGDLFAFGLTETQAKEATEGDPDAGSIPEVVANRMLSRMVRRNEIQ